MEMTGLLSSEIKHVTAKKIVLGIVIVIIVVAAVGVDRFINADRVYYLSLHQEAAGNVDEAKKGYTDVLQMNPWHADANYQLGVIMGREGNTSEALRLMNRALMLKKDPDYYLGLGYLYLNNLKDTKKAKTNFQEAYELNPKSYYACFMLGDLAERDRNHEKAITYYKKAIKIDPSVAASYKKLAAIYDARGMNDMARQYWQTVLEVNPKDKEAKAYFSIAKPIN